MLTRLATETCHKLTVPSVWCSKKGLVEYSSLCGVAHVILRGSEALLRILDAIHLMEVSLEVLQKKLTATWCVVVDWVPHKLSASI